MRTIGDLFRSLPIRFKLLVVYSALFALVILMGSAAMLSFIHRTIEQNIENELAGSTETLVSLVRANAHSAVRNRLRATVEAGKEVLERLCQEAGAGRISESEAKRLAADMLLGQAAGGGGRLCVIDSAGGYIVRPQDAVLTPDLVRRQIQGNEGYIRYKSKSPGTPEARFVVFYFSRFQPWGWILFAFSYEDESQSLVSADDIRDSVLAIRFGKTGYTFIIDSHGKLIVHPKLEGQNVYGSRDADGRAFLAEMCARKTGKIIYPWKNPGEQVARQKLAVFDYIPELDWIVASSGYLEEFYGPLETVRNIVVATSAIMLFLVLILTLWLSALITLPLKELMTRFALGSAGDLSVRMNVRSGDEIGRLSRYFNEFMERLETSNKKLRTEMAERELAEKAVRESEQKFRLLFERSADAMLILDGEHFTDCNAAAMAMMRCSDKEDLLSIRPSALSPEPQPDGRSSSEKADELIREAFERGTLRFEWLHRRLDGEEFPVDVTFTSVPLAGKPVLYTVWRDITARKRAEAQVRSYQEHLEELVEARTRELEVAKEKAEAGSRAKTAFLARMSHELRTPLNHIIGFADLLAEELEDTANTDLIKDVASIRKAAGSLLSLLQNVLDLSAADREPSLELSRFDVSTLLNEAATRMREKAASRGDRIAVAVDPDIASARTDRTRLATVLASILDNAVRFTTNGAICISAHRRRVSDDARWLVIRVRDEGIGIPADQVERIFEPFAQVDESFSRASDGAGLGLAIARRLSRLLGGDVVITDTAPGKGTTVEIRVPDILAPLEPAT